MKARKIVLTICLAVCLVLCSGNDGCEIKEENSQRKEIYSIEYFPSEESPQIAVIVALECVPHGGERFTTYGCGHCFRAAFKELSEKYEIGKITPILYELFKAPITNELIVRIKKKE